MMLTPFDRNMIVLHQRIREAANYAPPERQHSADLLADIEERDIRERLWTCETPEAVEALIVGYLHIWGATA